MQIFIQDDRAYQHWVTHHRRGFVIDGRRRPGWRDLVLHRATCPHVRSRVDRRTHWTTAGKFKACAHSWQELQAWAEEDTGEMAGVCGECRPLVEQETVARGSALTKLAADVLDYVLESAAIHLENEYPPYRLCVGDIAACFAKTPGQLASALGQLVDDSLVLIERRAGNNLTSQQKVFPTSAALRTLPAFRDSSDSTLEMQIARLHAP